MPACRPPVTGWATSWAVSARAGNETIWCLLQTVGDVEDGKVVATLPVFSGREGLRVGPRDTTSVNSSRSAQRYTDHDHH